MKLLNYKKKTTQKKPFRFVASEFHKPSTNQRVKYSQLHYIRHWCIATKQSITLGFSFLDKVRQKNVMFCEFISRNFHLICTSISSKEFFFLSSVFLSDVIYYVNLLFYWFISLRKNLNSIKNNQKTKDLRNKSLFFSANWTLDWTSKFMRWWNDLKYMTCDSLARIEQSGNEWKKGKKKNTQQKLHQTEILNEFFATETAMTRHNFYQSTTRLQFLGK